MDGPADVVVTGAGGQLGSVLLPLAVSQGRRVWGTVSPTGLRPAGHDLLALDLRDPGALLRRVAAEPPSVIVHLAAVSRVADAARDPLRAHEVNVELTAELVALARRLGARLVFASTDMVFDGHAAPYGERDTPLPTSTYGRTKLAAESFVLGYECGVVARLPLMFGIPPLSPDACHLADLARACSEGPPIGLFEDEYRTPMSLADAALSLLEVADATALTGVIHLAGPERVSRLELGLRFAACLGVAPRYRVVRAGEQTWSEPRPPDLSLHTSRYYDHFGQSPGRPLDDALAESVRDLRRQAC